MKEIYPVTIISDRYGGTYSGSAWLAFNRDPEDVPEDVSADDVTCAMFWEHQRSMEILDRKHAMPIGRGNGPDEALQDLYRRIPEEDR
jgi:hypothetical protein